MVEISFPKVGAVVLTILGFINLIHDTLIGDFFRWIPFLGKYFFEPVFQFVVDYFAYLGAVAFAFMFLQWTKNFYILLTLAVLFILFVKFGLRAVTG